MTGARDHKVKYHSDTLFKILKTTGHYLATGMTEWFPNFQNRWDVTPSPLFGL